MVTPIVIEMPRALEAVRRDTFADRFNHPAELATTGLQQTAIGEITTPIGGRGGQ